MKFPVSQDSKTQNQVAAVLLIRELRRLANGEPSELERRAAIAMETRRAETTGSVAKP